MVVETEPGHFEIPSIADFSDALYRRGFDRAHIVDIGEDSWGIEHPVACALSRLDESTMTMRTLRDVCELWRAFDEEGLADGMLERRGPGRYSIRDSDIDELYRRLETE